MFSDGPSAFYFPLIYLSCGVCLSTGCIFRERIYSIITGRDLAAWRYTLCLLLSISLDDNLSKSWSKRSHRWFIQFESYPWFEVSVCLTPYLISPAKSQFVNTNWKHARVSVHVNLPLHFWCIRCYRQINLIPEKCPGISPIQMENLSMYVKRKES